MKYLLKAPLGAMAALALTTPAWAQGGEGPADDGAPGGWSGLYAGGSIGLGWKDDDRKEHLRFDTNGDGVYDDSVVDGGGNDIFTGYCPGRAASGNPADGCTGDRVGTTWAGHVGYDRQFGNIVAGLVAEGGLADIRDSVTGFTSEPADYTLTRRLRQNAQVRARVGYALGNTLLYATGGGAYGRIRNSFNSNLNTANAFAGSGDSDAWGYTVGGGIEQKIARNFSVGLLYKYTSLNPDNYHVTVGQGSAAADGPFTNPATTSSQTAIERSHDRFNYHSAMVTASYRF